MTAKAVHVASAVSYSLASISGAQWLALVTRCVDLKNDMTAFVGFFIWKYQLRLFECKRDKC
jgi:hypothetical protein